MVVVGGVKHGLLLFWQVSSKCKKFNLAFCWKADVDRVSRPLRLQLEKLAGHQGVHVFTIFIHFLSHNNEETQLYAYHTSWNVQKRWRKLITYVWFTSIKQHQMSNTCWIYLDQSCSVSPQICYPKFFTWKGSPVANSLPLNVVGTQDIWTRFWPRFYAQIHPHHLRCASCVSLWSSRMWRCHSVTRMMANLLARWWFQTFSIFTSIWGRSNLTDIFQMGWNHLLVGS